MRKILFSILLILFAWNAGAATYYMRADGTVSSANKANATGCSSADTALSVAQHNGATFSGGDTIYLCDTGGDFTAGIVVPSSGASAASRIVYTKAPGASPVIHISAATNTGAITGSSKDYITIDNLYLQSDSATKMGINWQNSVDLIIQNCTLKGGYSGADLFGTLTVTLTNINASSAQNQGGILIDGDYGAVNVIVNGLTVDSGSSNSSSGGLWINNAATAVINNVTISGSTMTASLHGVTIVLKSNNSVIGSNWNISNVAGRGVNVTYAAGTPTGLVLILSKILIDTAGTYGIALTGSATYTSLNISYFLIKNSGSYGLSIADNSTGIFANGTIVNATTGGIVANHASAAPVLKNMIIQGTRGVGAKDVYNVSSAGEMSYSCIGMANASLSWSSMSHTTAISTGCDPLFVSATDYHLRSDSPGVNAGIPVNVGLTTDIEGKTVNSDHPEIGCYEYKPAGWKKP